MDADFCEHPYAMVIHGKVWQTDLLHAAYMSDIHFPIGNHLMRMSAYMNHKP